MSAAEADAGRSATLTILLLCAAVACEPTQSRPETPEVHVPKVPVIYVPIDTADLPSSDELLRPIECPALGLRLRSSSRSLRPRVCELAQQLWSAIREGGAASIGVSRGDTAQVRCGLVGRPFVTDLREIDPRSADVDFGFADRGYSIVAHVDTTGRIAGIERSEGLSDCPAAQAPDTSAMRTRPAPE